MKHLSILMISRGISLIWLSDEYPVPKSSSATLTPSAFITLSIRFMRTMSLIARLSVLKTQISRFYAHLVNFAFDFLNYVILQQLHHRQIYVDLVVRMSHVIPVPAVLRRLS